jgi:hypothetical protein
MIHDGVPTVMDFGPPAGVRPQMLALHFLRLIRPSTPLGFSKVRVGNDRGDGGYVMVDDWRDVVGAVSIGIGGDVSWDLAIAERGIDVHQFDHTVSRPPVDHPRFYFRPIGVGGDGSTDTPLRSLEHIVREIAPRGELVLKMDVEGAEWAALATAPAGVMERFSQIVIEVHGPLAGSVLDAVRNVLVARYLRRTHRVVHVHANNYAPAESFDGIRVPNVLELSYFRRTRATFRPSRDALPSVEDLPNDPLRAEIGMTSILAQTRDRR